MFNTVLNTTPEGEKHRTILEIMRDAGKGTGLQIGQASPLVVLGDGCLQSKTVASVLKLVLLEYELVEIQEDPYFSVRWACPAW